MSRKTTSNPTKPPPSNSLLPQPYSSITYTIEGGLRLIAREDGTFVLSVRRPVTFDWQEIPLSGERALYLAEAITDRIPN